MANQSELPEPTRRERLLLPPALDYENAPTEALELRLRQLLANTDLSLMGPYGAQLTTIGEVLERRRAATLASLAPDDLPSPVPARAEYDAASALQKIHDFEVLCSTTKSERWEQLRTEYARRVLDGEDVQPVIEAAVIAKGGYSREEGVLRLARRLVSRRLRDNPVKLAAATAGTQVATTLTPESSLEHAAGAADDSNGKDTETQAAAAETATSSETSIRRAEVASSQDRQVPEQSRREKKLVRRNQKYKTIDEALKKVADSRPQTQEEVFKALEGRVVFPPGSHLSPLADGWRGSAETKR